MVDPAPLAPDDTDEAPKQKRKFRDLFEGFGIALLMAVFFKYFAIEAYQIPTSSMQPTMMGSVTAGVYDRLIVDKFRYALTEPQRWDIAVFKYPIRQIQNYVKRIVGVGGDTGERLRISGGNVYKVVAGDGSKPEDLRVLRKPPRLQSEIWKEIFPARMRVIGGSNKVLGDWFSGRGGGWSESDESLEFTPRNENSRATLAFAPSVGEGVENEVWDGYPTAVAQQLREAELAEEKSLRDVGRRPRTRQQVQDVRIGFTLTSERAPKRLSIDIGLERNDASPLEFGLRVEGALGSIVIAEQSSVVQQSEPFDLVLDGGDAHEFRLAHIDDTLTFEFDGSEIASLDCSGYRSLDLLKLVTPTVRVDGGGKLRIEDLVVERDLHYVTSTNTDRNTAEERAKVIEVPAGHFMMLGDNTLQSVDSRDWTQLEIGVLDGRIVDPKRHPEATKMRGNLRAMPLDREPDADENPVPVTSMGKVVFTDQAGEIWTFDGTINLDAPNDNRYWARGAWFAGDDGPWKPETQLVQFVPRQHIIGRPLLNFWPLWSPMRFGLIK